MFHFVASDLSFCSNAHNMYTHIHDMFHFVAVYMIYFVLQRSILDTRHRVPGPHMSNIDCYNITHINHIDCYNITHINNNNCYNITHINNINCYNITHINNIDCYNITHVSNQYQACQIRRFIVCRASKASKASKQTKPSNLKYYQLS